MSSIEPINFEPINKKSKEIILKDCHTNNSQQQQSSLKENIGENYMMPQQSQQTKPKITDIFHQQNSKPSGFNIFTQKSQNQKRNIFSQLTKSVNLFNISKVPQSVNSNIFKKTCKKSLLKNIDQDEEKSSSLASSNGIKKDEPQFQCIPQKLQMKFTYQNPWTIIKSYNLKKFKSGKKNQNIKENIYITFERNSKHPKSLHVCLRAKETKVMLFEGICMKDVTNKISNFMNRQDCIKFFVIKENVIEIQDQQGVKHLKPQFYRQEIKIQFERIEDADDFKQFSCKEFEGKPSQNSESKELNANQQQYFKQCQQLGNGCRKVYQATQKVKKQNDFQVEISQQFTKEVDLPSCKKTNN